MDSSDQNQPLPGSPSEPDVSGAVADPVSEPVTEPVTEPVSEPVGAAIGDPATGEVEAVIPPVVVVMVAHNPGWWFEEALSSVVAQGYGNSSLLVVDSGSDTDLEARIAAAAPDAHLRRVAGNVGFGPAANEARRAVEGAAFYLFCHDDVRLDPDVVQVMVEEAYRSNAGVVGGKIVQWEHPERILEVGMGADKTGAPAPAVERGELDQEQHDAVRDVFYVPGAATLVRADLFEALDGFDPAIDLLGEDLDLSWRAHVVGARVLVAPSARIGHLEALGERRPIDDRRLLQMRHRLRTSKVCYSFASRLRIMPQAFAIAMVELVYSLLAGRFRQAGDVVSAWWWNVRRHGQIRARRKALHAHRAVPDREIRPMQVRGSSRLSGFLRGQIGPGDDRIGNVTGAGRELVTNLRSTSMRSSVVAWSAVLVLLAVGSRQLFTDGVPTTGGLAAFPTHPSVLMHSWASGFREVGLGSETAAPTLSGLLGLLGYLFFGAMGLLRTVVLLGALPLGALGMWRLARPIGSRRARIVALFVYVGIPVGFNALAVGHWTGLVLYGFAPWIVNQLAKSSGLSPFGSVGGEAGPGAVDRPARQRILVLGVTTALAALVAPIVVVMVPLIALALVVGGLLTGERRGALRTLGVGAGGAGVAIVLQLPWSVSVLTGGWGGLVGVSSSGGRDLDLGSLLRFETGPFGAAPLGWLLLVAGSLVLLIGRQWRLGWGVRAWVLVLAGSGAALVSIGGSFPGWFPATEVLLAPAAVGLALAAGLGMTAFELDLPDYRLGWRQLAALLAAAALVLGVLPALS
ncbi:MAG TPA: glycosyltransferase family 2 protein, partial [Acidimicrobiales bacterium]